MDKEFKFEKVNVELNSNRFINFDEVINLPDLKDSYAVIGIGSHFRNLSNESSDIDFLVIKERNHLIKKVINHQNVNLDLTICSLGFIVKSLNQAYDRNFWNENLLDGVFLKESEDINKAKIDFLLNKFEMKRKYLQNEQIQASKALCNNYLRKLKDLNERDHYNLMQFISNWSSHLYEFKCNLSGVLPKFNHRLRAHHIDTYFPELNELLNGIQTLDQADIVEKIEAFHYDCFAKFLDKSTFL